MNGNPKNVICLVLSIAIVIPSILFVGDYIYFQEPLSRVGLYPEDPRCDKDCADKIDDRYKCVEIKPDDFVCRLERGYSVGDEHILFTSAGPISYGEIGSFPVDKDKDDDGDNDDNGDKWFNIKNVKIVDENSKTVQVDFYEVQENNDDSLNPIYTAKLKPSDTFLSCVNPWNVKHLVQYTDIYEYENKTYAEFWGLHPYVPPELFPCEPPKIFEYSLRTNYDIVLPKYEEFGFD